MTRIREIKTTFTAGEVSHEILGRGDLRAYENGALTCDVGGPLERPVKTDGPEPWVDQAIWEKWNARLTQRGRRTFTYFFDEESIAYRGSKAMFMKEFSEYAGEDQQRFAFYVAGHASAGTGSQTGNLKISLQRAEVIAGMLEEAGIDSYRICKVPLGTAQSSLRNASRYNRSANANEQLSADLTVFSIE